MEILPLEQSVNCTCDFRLTVPVVTYNPWSEAKVQACLHCGRVECSISRGDEPRGAGPVGGNTFLIPLPAEWYAWLGQWPRMLSHSPLEPLWAPPDFRVTTFEELQAARGDAGGQSTMTPASRLLQFACPRTPPPAVPRDRAGELRFYVQLWDAVQDAAKLEEFLWTSCYCK